MGGGGYSNDYEDEPTFRDEPDERRRTDEQRRTRRASRKKKPIPDAANGGGCNWGRCCFHSTIALLAVGSIVAVVVGVMYALDDDEPQPAASCGDCWCSLDDTVTTCPTKPRSDVTVDFIEAFMIQQPFNPVEEVACDPFENDSCKPAPELMGFGPKAACGLHYSDEFICTSYQLQTYETKDIAESAGAFVTHLGPCGVCSTTQDLAVLLQYQPDLFTVTEKCATHSINTVNEGKACYEKLGFTPACAKLKAQQAHTGGKHCLMTCQTSDLLNTPFNEDPPSCALNKCLQCQEDRTGAMFSVFAGRTMRTSGIVSSIVRKCSEVATIQQKTCPPTHTMKFPN